MNIQRIVRIAYLAVAGFRSCLSRKIKIHDNLFLLLHLLLFICAILTNAIQPAFIIA